MARLTDPDKIHRSRTIHMLWSSIREGRYGLNAVPGLLKQTLTEKMWVEFEIEFNGETFLHKPKNFINFVTDQPPHGLGSSIEIIKKLCAGHPDVIDLIDGEVKREGGDHLGNQYTIQLDNNGTVYNIHSSISEDRPSGTTQQAGLRRLRAEIAKAETEDKRECIKALQKKVFDNEISVNRALVVLGVRRETFTIPVDPESAAKSIKKRFNSEQLTRLIELLLSD